MIDSWASWKMVDEGWGRRAVDFATLSEPANCREYPTATPTKSGGHAMNEIGFLHAPAPTAAAQRLFDDDLAEVGFVMNVSRLWAYQPATVTGLFDLMRQATSAYPLDLRQRGILVAACASTFGDSLCSVAWGSRLAAAADAHTAASVLRGDDDTLTAGERAMAGWARKITRGPNLTSAADVQELRDAGFDDAQIFAITAYVALRLAFSTVNDALGVLPDATFRDTTPPAVLDAITFGRPFEDEPRQRPTQIGTDVRIPPSSD